MKNFEISLRRKDMAGITTVMVPAMTGIEALEKVEASYTDATKMVIDDSYYLKS